MEKLSEQQQDIALWRYGIISPLLHRGVNDRLMQEALTDLACKNYRHPSGESMTFSPETLRKWLYRYARHGLPGLADKQRSDKGRYQIPDNLVEALIALRKDHPRWTLARILKDLLATGQWNGTRPSRSALYRFASARNLHRDPHLETVTARRSFAFDRFGQLWVADFLHGPKLWIGKKKKKTYLHLILDDCSRFVVHAGFYASETVEPLICDLMEASKRFGLPQRFYTDNGAAYSSRHLKMVCARCGIQLVHTPPYVPQGRGKVERAFRTIRDQFLSGVKFSGLAHINREFNHWLARYHEGIHSALGCSPRQKRLEAGSVCRPLPPAVDADALFRMEKRCRVYSNGTVRLKNNIYEVPGCLPGSRTTIYYVPWEPHVVYFGDDMQRACPVNLQSNARRFDNPGLRRRRAAS